ncbi:MAG: hypothetical protein V2A70_08455 [Candidatus Omnitrophota bacterium]
MVVCSSIYKHTVIFERVVNGRVHRFKYSKDCRLHSDIYEAVFDRALRRNVVVDINDLIDSVVCKRGMSLEEVQEKMEVRYARAFGFLSWKRPRGYGQSERKAAHGQGCFVS